MPFSCSRSKFCRTMEIPVSEKAFGSSGLYEIDDCLIITLQNNIDDRGAAEICHKVLDFLEHFNLKHVIIDLTSVPVVDRKVFQIIKDCAGMTRLMGAEAVFAGIQPGVASTLVDLDVDIQWMQTVCTIREGMALLKELRSSQNSARRNIMQDDCNESAGF